MPKPPLSDEQILATASDIAFHAEQLRLKAETLAMDARIKVAEGRVKARRAHLYNAKTSSLNQPHQRAKAG